MTASSSLGELEHLVLLAILQCGDEAGAVEIRRRIEEDAERPLSRSTVYTTLGRLEGKGFVEWEQGAEAPARGGIPRRTFRVTPDGMEALHAFRRAIARLSRGLEGRLRWLT